MSAGPAVLRATAPVETKIPAPITAPIPRLVSVTGPRTRRNRFSPFISSRRRLRGFVANSLFAIQRPPGLGPKQRGAKRAFTPGGVKAAGGLLRYGKLDGGGGFFRPVGVIADDAPEVGGAGDDRFPHVFRHLGRLRAEPPRAPEDLDPVVVDEGLVVLEPFHLRPLEGER